MLRGPGEGENTTTQKNIPVPGLLFAGQTLEKSLRTAVNEEVAVKVRVRETVAAVKHAYTHFRITLHAFRCVTQNGKPHALGCERWLWATRQDLDNLPFSRADRKILEALSSHLRQA